VVILLFLLGKVNLICIWLQNNILFLFLNTEHIESCPAGLSYFGSLAYSDGALVLFHIFVILYLSICIQYEKSNLFIAVPILLTKQSFKMHFWLRIDEILESVTCSFQHGLSFHFLHVHVEI
jgi:hypothetical protein